MKRATLEELANLVDGTVLGDAAVSVSRVAPIDVAQDGDITFVTNPKYIKALETTAASAVIVSPALADRCSKPGLVCKNPYLAFAKILTFLSVEPPEVKGVMAGSHVSTTADIGADVTIYPGCYVGDNVKVGRGTTLYAGVVLYAEVEVGEECLLHAGTVVREKCRIANRVILQPKAVIGSDGFGFAPDGSRYFKIPQVGVVVLEDDVEIGASSTIDRAALGVTRIRRGTKIDNLVQIGHNVELGEDCILVAQTGIAGSTVIGNHCTFGGQSATNGHIRIGDNLTVGSRGGVTSSIDGNQVVSGVPAMPHRDWLKASMTFPKLPEMRRELSRLKNKIEKLESELKEKE
jgi:UDP-3-O-[3-hydroxymyristoyl] glucosamine N-acyltransferase